LWEKFKFVIRETIHKEAIEMSKSLGSGVVFLSVLLALSVAFAAEEMASKDNAISPVNTTNETFNATCENATVPAMIGNNTTAMDNTSADNPFANARGECPGDSGNV
jgi:hypothetical protein